VLDALRSVLLADARIAYALLFGSAARGTMHTRSDIDVAVGTASGQELTPRDLGDLAAKLEAAVARPVHLVLLAEAPPGLAYRVFRDGHLLVVRDEQALKSRLTRAILEYLDYRPVEETFTRGVLSARRGR
jgi:predicted nucleotidyltransferase